MIVVKRTVSTDICLNHHQHLMGNDNWNPSKKSKMKPIDFL